MKTNHNRGFEARPDARSRLEEQAMKAPHFEARHAKGKQSSWTEKLALSGKKIFTFIHPNGGDHSEEKCRRGAKRHINRMARRHENEATRKLVDNDDGEI